MRETECSRREGGLVPPATRAERRQRRVGFPRHTNISSYTPADISHTDGGGLAGRRMRLQAPSRRGRAGRSPWPSASVRRASRPRRRLPYGPHAASVGNCARDRRTKCLCVGQARPPTPPAWAIAHATVGRNVCVSGRHGHARALMGNAHRYLLGARPRLLRHRLPSLDSIVVDQDRPDRQR